MSGNRNGRNGRDSQAYETLETQLALEGVRQENSTAAKIIVAAQQIANLDPDDSPTENPIWIYQSRQDDRAAAQLEAQDQKHNISDSDPLPASPAQGIPRRRASFSEIEDALTYTALAQPEIRSSSRIPYSRSREEARQRREQLAEARLDELTRATAAEARETRRRLLTAERDEHERSVREFRDPQQEQELVNEMNRRIDEFAQSDPEAHRSWADYRDLALRTADHPAHQYQMLQWYTGGPEGSVQDASRSIPPRLLRSIRRVEEYTTHLGRLEFRHDRAEFALREAEVEFARQRAEGESADGTPEVESPGVEPIDDGGMASMEDYDLFGYERRDLNSAFRQYVSPPRLEGDEEAQLAHVRDSFHARRIRVLHADSEGEFDILLRRLRSFSWAALRALDELSENEELPEAFRARVATEMSAIGNFHVRRLQYQGPSGGVRAAEEEMNSSFYEPIQSGVAANAASDEEDEDGEEGDDSDEEKDDDDGEDGDTEETSEEQSEDQSEEESQEQSQDHHEDQGERQEDDQDEQRGQSIQQAPALEDEDLYGYSGDER
ncbi:hypothetical protein MBLNU13_g05243t1 [Cladosporium sp. NU13]